MRKILIFALITVLVTICIPAFALTSQQKEANFRSAVFQLEAYLESAGDDASFDLMAIRDAFDELGGYENSNFFKYYVTVLYMIENNEFSAKMELYMGMIDYPSFSDYLNESFKDSAIRPIEELKAYALGRENEYTGNNSLACEYYYQCLSFFDAINRYEALQNDEMESVYDEAVALFETGHFDEAYYLFKSISKYKDSSFFMEHIQNKIGVIPIETTSEPKALSTDIPEITTPASAPTSILTEPEATKKEQAHSHSWENADCTHPKTCSACGATEGSALGHNWQAADCTHAKTCTRCGATEGSALGHSWQAATENAPKTCTRCGVTEGSKLTWSEWSEWSTASVATSSTRQVETRTKYHYSRWHYYNTKENAWYNHYKEYKGSQYKEGSGEWQYKTTTSPLAYKSTVEGHKVYEGYWYLSSTSTEYRYRDLK